MDAIQKLDQAEIEKLKAKKKIADFRPGDTVKVHCNVVEGDKRRVQVFEGIVTRRRGVGLSANVTVRKLAAGNIGVERTFPLYSVTVARIDVVRRGKVRRARLYYLRDRVGKATRVIEGSALTREELEALKAPLELDTGAGPAAKGEKADKKADKGGEKKADAGKGDKAKK